MLLEMKERTSCSLGLPGTQDGQRETLGLRLWLFLILRLLFYMVKV